MKILVVSKYGDILALMHKVMVEEGVDVIAYIDDKKEKEIYDGLLEKVDSFADLLKLLEKDDIVYFDFTGFGNAGYELSRRGYKVYGGWKLADKLELRDYATKFNNQVGIFQPESVVFTDITSAVDYIDKNKKLYVVKTDSEDSSSTFVPDTHYEETIIYLNDMMDEKINKIELQEKKEGIEVTLTLRFFKGMLITSMMDSTIEEKRFLAGNLGVNTGCSSTIILPYKQPPKMFNKVVTPDFLYAIEQSEYTGVIDINTMYIPDEDRYYFLEYTPRSGYNYEYAYKELLDVPYIEYLNCITTGESCSIKSDMLGGALRVTTPPYPVEKSYSLYKGKYISWGIKNITTSVYVLDALVKNDMLFSKIPLFMEIATVGKDVQEVENKIFEQVNNIILPYKQYRIDAFERAKKHIDIIKKVNII